MASDDNVKNVESEENQIQKQKRIRRKFDHKLSEEEKKELQRERYRKWHQKKYNEDPEFREKRKEKMKERNLRLREDAKKWRESQQENQNV